MLMSTALQVVSWEFSQHGCVKAWVTSSGIKVCQSGFDTRNQPSVRTTHRSTLRLWWKVWGGIDSWDPSTKVGFIVFFGRFPHHQITSNNYRSNSNTYPWCANSSCDCLLSVKWTCFCNSKGLLSANVQLGKHSHNHANMADILHYCWSLDCPQKSLCFWDWNLGPTPRKWNISPKRPLSSFQGLFALKTVFIDKRRYQVVAGPLDHTCVGLSSSLLSWSTLGRLSTCFWSNLKPNNAASSTVMSRSYDQVKNC